jgi:hypothetical protein
MELKKAYELESSLKVTLVIRDEQVSETEEAEEEDSDSHNGNGKDHKKGLLVYNPQVQD